MAKKPIFSKSRKNIPRGASYVDTVAAAQKELFIIRNPRFKGTAFQKTSEWKIFLRTIKGKDKYVYWPSTNAGAHILDEALYFEARTARNKNLITQKEQAAYRNIIVGIAGLSVGSAIVSSLALTGGPKTMKIADFDILEPSNMNRIRAKISDIGRNKIDMIADEVWGMDPFARLILWERGLTEKSLQKFMIGSPRLDIFIDEMDNLALKVLARYIAKKKRMPVLMATDNGDGIILDVERFDQEPRREIFHGLVGSLTVTEAREAKGKAWFALVEKIIGIKFMPERHKASLREVGKTLAGVPQLGTDALSAGALMAFVVRKIANGERLPSGRYIFNMESIIKKSMVR